jgi:hypothetical protein
MVHEFFVAKALVTQIGLAIIMAWLEAMKEQILQGRNDKQFGLCNVEGSHGMAQTGHKKPIVVGMLGGDGQGRLSHGHSAPSRIAPREIVVDVKWNAQK